MFDQILEWAVIALPTLFAIILELINENIRNDKRWRWGVLIFGIVISLLTAIQIYRSNASREKAQENLKSELDQSLLNQQYTKGQLDSLSIMVGRLGQSNANDGLAAALRQMAQATAQKVADLKASNADLCKRARTEAQQIRTAQEQFDVSEQARSTKEWERRLQAKTEEEKNQLYRQEISAQVGSIQAHEADFRNKFMPDAKYLHDLLIDRVPPDEATTLRGSNEKADMSLTTSMLFGELTEYAIADYLDALANTVCSQPKQTTSEQVR